MRWLGRIVSDQQVSWAQVLKTSIAIAVAWFASIALLRVELPIFAAIAALLVVAPSVNQSLGKGLERSVGVIGGVVLAWGVSEVVGASSLTVLALVIACVVLSRILRLAQAAATQVAISAMLMLALGTGSGPEWAIDRVLETVIGAVCALVVNLVIVPPVQHEPAERALRALADAIADAFDAVGDALVQTGWEDREALLDRARSLRPGIARARTAMDALEDSLRLNPRRRGLAPRIERDERLLLTLTILTNRVIGMARTVADRLDGEGATDPVVREIASETHRIAHDVRLLVERHAHEDGRTRSMPTLDEPLLTSAITTPRPHPTQWVLIGALLEDVRQVRDSLAGVDVDSSGTL